MKNRKPRILILGPDWKPYEFRLFHRALPDLLNGKMTALDKWRIPYDFSGWDSGRKNNGWDKWKEFSKLLLSVPPSERGLDWEFFSLADEARTPIAYPQICVINNKNRKWRPKGRSHPEDHAIFLRDFYSCCYCGRPVVPRRHRDSPEADTATIDHIVPVSRWNRWAGDNSPNYPREGWKNKCTSCHECNHRKGNRLNEEVGYVLRRKPVVPTWTIHRGARMTAEFLKESWLDFLYPDCNRTT